MTDHPPYSYEVEADCIAWCLQNPRTAPDAIFGVTTPADFYVPEFRETALVIVEMIGRGQPISDDTVGARLADRTKGRLNPGWLTAERLKASPCADPRGLGLIVAEDAARRRAIGLAGELRDAALAGPLDAVEDVLATAGDTIRVRRAQVAEARYASDLEQAEESYDWLIPHLIERLDRVVITGVEGAGKSLLLRQLAVCAALGIHPFTHVLHDPVMVLVLDFENSWPQNIREYRRFWPLAARFGNRWNQKRVAVISGVAVDLSTEAGDAWLWAQVEHYVPDLVILGPLYKTYRGGRGRAKDSEETAELVVAALDRLRQRFGVTLVMEGHSPHGDSGDRAGGRLRGSSLWQAWPEFVFHLREMPDKTGYQLLRARGPRDRERDWPFTLRPGKRPSQFPWVTDLTPDLPPFAPKFDDEPDDPYAPF